MEDETKPVPAPAPEPVNEKSMAPSKRPSVRDSFFRGVTSPVGTKSQAGSLPTVMLPRRPK